MIMNLSRGGGTMAPNAIDLHDAAAFKIARESYNNNSEAEEEEEVESDNLERSSEEEGSGNLERSSEDESQGFDFNLEDAWHYGFVLNSPPRPHTCKPLIITKQQAQPSLSSSPLSKPAPETSATRNFSKLQSAAGTASRNARHKREMERLFATYDEDNDGHISRCELESVMKKLGIEISEDELNCMLRSVDKNGDGFVDFEEFVDFQDSLSVPGKVSSSLAAAAAGDEAEGGASSQCNGMISSSTDAADDDDSDLREAFDVFDKYGDGFICTKELHSVLHSLGISADTTFTSCQNMISAVDRNGDSRVDFAEFKDLMTADP